MGVLDPTLLEIAPPGPGNLGLPPDLPYGENLLYWWFPLRPLDAVHAHLRLALISVLAKRLSIDRRWDYYLGRHEERILSEKLRSVIYRGMMPAVLESMFTNYCSLVVEAPLARLSVTGWKGTQQDVDQANDLWEDNDLDADAEEIHRQAITAGEAYVIVWPRIDRMTGDQVLEDGAPVMDIALQDARNMHVHYGSRRRGDKLWASKVWLDVDEQSGGMHWRAVMYYSDVVVRLWYPPEVQATSQCPQDPRVFVPDPQYPSSPNPMGKVPVVRFARKWDGRSTLDDVIPIQDRINKLTGDKVVAAEFGAFPQRYALTNDEPPAEALRAGPGAIWKIPPASTSPDGNTDQATTVGQFPVTELANYDSTIAAETSALFTVAQLPRHLMVVPGVAPSGEAIKADEGPMVAAVRGYVRMFGAAWSDVMNLCGVAAEPVWQDVEIHNELTAAQCFQTLAMGGMPLRMAAEYALDLPEEELDELALLPVPPQPGAGLPGQGATPPERDLPAEEDQGVQGKPKRTGRLRSQGGRGR